MTQEQQDQSQDDADPPCNCECCVSQRRDDLISNGLDGSDSVKCAPRSEIGGSLGDGGCTQQCTTENPAQYQAMDSSVDYSRFCLKECRPETAQLNELCSAAPLDSPEANSNPAPASKNSKA